MMYIYILQEPKQSFFFANTHRPHYRSPCKSPDPKIEYSHRGPHGRTTLPRKRVCAREGDPTPRNGCPPLGMTGGASQPKAPTGVLTLHTRRP